MKLQQLEGSLSFHLWKSEDKEKKKKKMDVKELLSLKLIKGNDLNLQ